MKVQELAIGKLMFLGIVTLLFLAGCGGGMGQPVNNQPVPGGSTSGTNPNPTPNLNPSPTINSLSPSCAPKGEQSLNPFTSGGQLLVNGQGFVASSVVRWNGNDRSTTFLSSGGLTAQISASDITAVGTAVVTVFNPAPGGGSSSVLTFTVTSGGVGPASIAVDPTGKFAYVANQGCGDSTFGNVSMYTIDSTTGVLASIGPPVPTNDEGGRAVAVDPSSRFAYVANSGEGDTAGSVSMYTINGMTGALTSTGTIQAPCAPPSSPGSCSPWSLAVHPSGKFAYVANEGGFTPTSVSMYAINATTGILRLIGTIATDGRATSVAVDPSGKFAYVANGGENSDASKGVYVSMYTIDATTGVLTSVGKTAAGVSASSIAIHPSGKFVYVANSDSNDISMYSINTTTGNLTSIGTLVGGGSIVFHPSGKFAYVTSSGGVAMYTVDATTGVLTFAGTTVWDRHPAQSQQSIHRASSLMG